MTSSAEPQITQGKVNRIAIQLRGKLHNGPRTAASPMLFEEVGVADEEIRPKSEARTAVISMAQYHAIARVA